MERLVEALGVTRLSKSQVSEMAKTLDEAVAAFRDRPLDAGPYRLVWMDALTQKVREGGRVQIVHALIAVGVNADGQREVLGVEVAGAEDGPGWLTLLRSLVARGLSGVQLVISDAHTGLVETIRAALPGASWQTVPHPLRPQPVLPGPQDRPAVGADPAADRVRPARRRRGPRPGPAGDRGTGSEVPARRRAPRRSSARPTRVHQLPARDLAPDLVEQPRNG
jgi:hypothetical protein